MTLGDFFGYMIGASGNNLLSSESRATARLAAIQEKRPYLIPIILFFYAGFAPAPNELVVIPAGLLRVKVGYVMIPVLLGNILFNSLIASGLVSLFS